MLSLLLYAFAKIKTPLGIAFCQPSVPNLTIKAKLMYLLHLQKQDSGIINSSDLEENWPEFNSWLRYLRACDLEALLTPSVVQFPHLHNGDKLGTDLTVLQRRLNENILARRLGQSCY